MPIITAIVTSLLPPIGLVVLALLGLALLRGRLGRGIAALALAGLLVLSFPVVGTTLLASLDVPSGPPVAAPDAEPPSAIVVLGGDVYGIPDPPGASIGGLSLERVRAGAALHRQTGLPILVTGGIVGSRAVPVGILMAQSLGEDFRVPVRWTEATSLTTWENAGNSGPMLAADGIGRVYLVTHAWHMQRSLLAFQRFGVDAVPAPVRRDREPAFGVADFLPSTVAWQRSFYAIHEWVGLAYYSLRQ